MRINRGFAVFALAAIVALFVPLSVSAADNFPNGCVSCHKGALAIPNMIAKIQGHPNVSKLVKSVPDGCAVCHKPGAKAPTLMAAIHEAHKIQAPADAKAADFTGKCLNCHAVDASGKVTIKKAPANW